VLSGAGAAWSDLVHLKICYMHDEEAEQAEQRLVGIMAVLRDVCGEPLPPITAFGVKLLYSGLTVEIDAMAAIGDKRVLPRSAECANASNQLAAIRVGGYTQVAGQNAPRVPGGLTRSVGEALRAAIARAQDMGAGPADLAHVHVFIESRAADNSSRPILEVVDDALRAALGAADLPSFTVVCVNGLPRQAEAHVNALAIASRVPMQ